MKLSLKPLCLPLKFRTSDLTYFGSSFLLPEPKPLFLADPKLTFQQHPKNPFLPFRPESKKKIAAATDEKKPEKNWTDSTSQKKKYTLCITWKCPPDFRKLPASLNHLFLNAGCLGNCPPTPLEKIDPDLLEIIFQIPQKLTQISRLGKNSDSESGSLLRSLENSLPFFHYLLLTLECRKHCF